MTDRRVSSLKFSRTKLSIFTYETTPPNRLQRDLTLAKCVCHANSEISALDNLIDTKKAAKLLDVSQETLRQSRCTGLLFGRPAPEYLKLGRRTVRYPMQELKDWLAGMPSHRTRLRRADALRDRREPSCNHQKVEPKDVVVVADVPIRHRANRIAGPNCGNSESRSRAHVNVATVTTDRSPETTVAIGIQGTARSHPGQRISPDCSPT